ncbi:polysaccharide biosynthesis protein [Photobacterium sanguinicancri]|uniref:Nucleoside-diphosphate sugar epimerase/dehydratase n=1 Tax=Photobacterium sanguinicancri TaxID=875932 RepID=A0AAW7Y6U0_9GAMM|nr:nucleoside-diphosphate sugar epimerase/dehydratase [Photobacterium sanguinicancri]MDO6542479.1 nucleoside-diphosphate sugar epimerase/dehydratase [Photobacterium sanguinicancri]
MLDKYLLSISRPKKRLFSIIIDVLFVFIAFWGAFGVRYGHFDSFLSTDLWQAFFLLTVVTIATFVKLGLYRAILRYLSFHALLVVSCGALISALALSVSGFYFSDTTIPRTVPIIYGAFLALLAGGARLLMRTIVFSKRSQKKKRVLIYGAGSTGRQLCIALRQSQDYLPVGFVDQDSSLFGTYILGLKVLPPKKIEFLIHRLKCDKVLLALPRASRSERKAILDTLANLTVEVLTVPSMEDIVNGDAKIDELRDVPIEDLLGRDPVAPRPELMRADTTGKVVMITGAGGSIGSELCRQILMQSPTKLILFELSEYGLYAIDKELTALATEHALNVEIIPLLGSVQRMNRLQAVMESFKVETLYHAAAYKHVPLVEYNVVEGVRNNVFGTMYTAQAAIKAKVDTFVLISTDKAVRPTNIMGTTKRMAELVLQALAKQDHQTRFCMVRFGNVLGSSGSVIPLFKKQIAQGGPVTVTHEDITRYFMTIPEAAQLVIQAGAMGKGGDVFVLDMGESVRITDLAKNLIKLSGLDVRSDVNPHGDIAIEFTGLRPGEKLYEELLIGDNVSKTNHERIMTAQELSLTWVELSKIIDVLDRACHDFDHETIRQGLLDAPTGFNPTDGISDLVWHANNEKENVFELTRKVSSTAC